MLGADSSDNTPLPSGTTAAGGSAPPRRRRSVPRPLDRPRGPLPPEAFVRAQGTDGGAPEFWGGFLSIPARGITSTKKPRKVSPPRRCRIPSPPRRRRVGPLQHTTKYTPT